jgi:hypothetical protein
VEPVVAELKLDKQGNQHKNRQPESKPKNIYKGEELVSPDIADSGFEVVCYHGSGFKVQGSRLKRKNDVIRFAFFRQDLQDFLDSIFLAFQKKAKKLNRLRRI